MRQIRIPLLISILAVTLAVVAFGCASPKPAFTPTLVEDAGHVAEEEAGHPDEEGEGHLEGTGTHEEPVLSGAALRGQALFNSAGCAVCHGENAEGTTIAPALPGHTETQTRRQVRAPVGIMPMFPPDKITSGQLDDLVAYIAGLGGGHAHQKASDIGAEMEMHHWMALFAIEDGDAAEGAHHVRHIIEFTEGVHQSVMQNVLAELEAGQLHDATHTVEEMLAGVLANGFSGATIHLRIALSSASIEDAEGTIDHVEHFIKSTEGTDREQGEAILAQAQAGDLTEAQHELTEFLEAMGAAVESEEHAQEEAHEEPNAHEETQAEEHGPEEETPTQ